MVPVGLLCIFFEQCLFSTFVHYKLDLCFFVIRLYELFTLDTNPLSDFIWFINIFLLPLAAFSLCWFFFFHKAFLIPCDDIQDRGRKTQGLGTSSSQDRGRARERARWSVLPPNEGTLHHLDLASLKMPFNSLREINKETLCQLSDIYQQFLLVFPVHRHLIGKASFFTEVRWVTHNEGWEVDLFLYCTSFCTFCTLYYEYII